MDRSPNFEVVEVSHQNKLELFSNAIEVSQQAIPETERLLSQLQVYDSTTAEQFRLKDETVSKVPFRLLTGVSEQAQNFGSFIALSYCWHNSSWAVAKGLEEPESEWPISPVMVKGLLAQRESDNEGIWIDQRCIKQSDEEEKMLAIACMDMVYKSARKVVVVLEDITLTRQQKSLVEYLIENQEAPESDWAIFENDLPGLSSILVTILSARIFSRAWCSHELQLGTAALFLVPGPGDELVEVTMDALESLYSVTSDFCMEHKTFSNLLVDVSLSYDFLTRAIQAKDRKEKSHEYSSTEVSTFLEGRSFMTEFSDILQLQCFVESDKVSISLNLAGLQLYYKGQNDSLDDCRWILAMVALSAGDARVLSNVEEPLDLNNGSENPSWMWWGEDLENVMVDSVGEKLTEVSSIASVDRNQITLDLFAFEGSLRLNEPSQSSLIRVEIFLTYLQKQMASVDRPYWMTHRASATEFNREFSWRQDILACSFDCGMEWMIEQTTSCAELAETVQTELTELRCDFPRIVLGALQLDTSLETEHRMRSLVQYFYFAIFHNTLSVGGGGYSYPQCSPWDTPRNSDELAHCWWMDFGASNKAIFVGARGSISPLSQALAVVPVALSGTSCAAVRRLWILEVCEDGRRLKLRGKFQAFTLKAIEADAPAIVRKHNQVIE